LSWGAAAVRLATAAACLQLVSRKAPRRYIFFFGRDGNYLSSYFFYL